MKILVLGATGMLGSVLVPLLRVQGHCVVTHGFCNQADLIADITKNEETNSILKRIYPDVVINLIGLTSVERCEENIHLAYLLNSKTVENLVNGIHAIKKNIHLIQISTDHVYDGAESQTEEDVRITNNYAITKYAGELASLRVSSTVLRTNFVGRSRNKERESFTDWIFNSMRSDNSISVLSDVLFSPLSMETLSKYIEVVAKKKPIGVFNLGSRGGMSKADFGFAFAGEVGLCSEKMNKITLSDAKFFRANRPRNMKMNSSKFEKSLDIVLPTVNDELRCLAKEYIHE